MTVPFHPHREYRLQEFSEAFAAGQELLKSGASAMDAVQEVSTIP